MDSAILSNSIPLTIVEGTVGVVLDSAILSNAGVALLVVFHVGVVLDSAILSNTNYNSEGLSTQYTLRDGNILGRWNLPAFSGSGFALRDNVTNPTTGTFVNDWSFAYNSVAFIGGVNVSSEANEPAQWVAPLASANVLRFGSDTRLRSALSENNNNADAISALNATFTFNVQKVNGLLPDSSVTGEGDAYTNGYNIGYNAGYSDGSTGASSAGQGAFNLLAGAFGALDGIISLQIFPGISIGMLVIIPIAGALLVWLIKLLKG